MRCIRLHIHWQSIYTNQGYSINSHKKREGKRKKISVGEKIDIPLGSFVKTHLKRQCFPILASTSRNKSAVSLKRTFFNLHIIMKKQTRRLIMDSWATQNRRPCKKASGKRFPTKRMNATLLSKSEQNSCYQSSVRRIVVYRERQLVRFQKCRLLVRYLRILRPATSCIS